VYTKLDLATSYVSIRFDLERVSARYTGQDTATMIAAYAAVWISATAWNTEMKIQPTRHEYVLQGQFQARYGRSVSGWRCVSPALTDEHPPLEVCKSRKDI